MRSILHVGNITFIQTRYIKLLFPTFLFSCVILGSYTLGHSVKKIGIKLIYTFHCLIFAYIHIYIITTVLIFHLQIQDAVNYMDICLAHGIIKYTFLTLQRDYLHARIFSTT